MSWTGLPATDETKWTAISFLNQFARAINERQEASYRTPTSLDVAEGDIVQGVSYLAGLQSAALDVLTRFQDPDTMDVTPGAIPANFAGASDWAGEQYTEQTAMDAAGLSDGFTRLRPREIEALDDAGEDGWVARYIGDADDGDFKVYTHNGSSWSLAADQTTPVDVIEVDSDFPRYIQAGDIIGAHLFNELQDLLQVARVVVYDDDPTGIATLAEATNHSDAVQEASSGGNYGSSAAATAAADTDWDTGSSTVGSTTPAKFSTIDALGGGQFRAWAYARRRTYTNDIVTGAYSYTQTAEIVFKPIAYGFFGTTFEDFDLTLVEGQHHLFDSGDFNASDELVIGGDTSQPTWEDDSDGVEGWGWEGGTDLAFRPTVVNVFTWEFD